jgi:hypothetical protein
MGGIIKAICSCGNQSKEMMIGFGFNYPSEEIVYHPAYCNQCGLIDVKGSNEQSPACGRCNNLMVFYKGETVPAGPDPFLSFPSMDYLEEHDKWYCPLCKRKELVFEDCGCWD